MDMKKMIDTVACVLLIFGGINWGLVGLFNMDLVARIFGPGTLVAKIVYDLIGFSAIYCIGFFFKK